MEKEEVLDRREGVAMARHMQAELGAGLRFLCKLESSLVSLSLIWSMTLCFSALTEWSPAIFERGLNSTGVCQRALVLAENQSPLCILVFLTPWISSTLAWLCPGVLGWSGSW